MTLNTITVSRALTWLKHFVPKWSSQINKRAADVIVNGRSMLHGQSAVEITDELKSTHQSIVDQVKMVYEKRKAINSENQKTLISVDGKEYTIADAMIYRQHAIPLLEQYVNAATNSINIARRQFADQNGKYQDAVQAQQNPTEASLQSIKALFEPTLITNTVEIEKLGEHIRSFKLEFDAILSEKNSITTIEV
jgi:hypothetical protein